LFVSQDIWPEAFGEQKPFTFNHFTAVTIGEIYLIALVSGIKLTADWLTEKSSVEKLNKEKLATELQLLKSQIRPHFFFNTLNNLYALSLEKSDLAPELVLKLSEIMEFVIYDSKKKEVLLSDEINYIQNYIEIEKIRFGDKINSTITYNNADISGVSIPPLLFLPFIENSFKHGLINNSNFNIKIIIRKEFDNKLFFAVSNTHNISTLSKQEKRGVGIKNVKRRLQLLYQENYKLKIVSLSSQFTIELTIPI
jgi:LytS/YehU family sensor histidine kinase